MAKSFRELLVWQRSMQLAETIFRITEDFPKREVYGLATQMRRAAVSIPSNLAEGANRIGRKEFRQFVTIARGSNNELQTQIELAQRVGILPAATAITVQKEAEEIGRMLHRLWIY
ncbi:four helix bundle protein, partial [Terriglobus sp. YAF25]